MARMGLKAYADRVAAAGRNGDTELAHLSPDEIEVLTSLQGHVSINPETGLPEFFSLKKILKGVAKAAGAIAGGYFGGPVGSAVGAGAVSKLLGDSTSTALSTGLLAGLGSWGAQQTGLGDYVGGGFSSGADLLGQQAAGDAIQTASGAADEVASSGGGMGLSAALPLIGLGGAALAAGTHKRPKDDDIAQPDEPEFQEYEPLDREQLAYAGDPYTYGIFGPEFQYFDEVNPGIQPVAMARGGRIYLAAGGAANRSREGRGPTGSGPGTGGGRGANRDRDGISNAERRAREQYSKSMQQGNMANLAGPHGYNSAVDRYNKRSGLWDALDWIGGPFIDVNPPDVKTPASYAGGDWHTSTNVGGALGAAAGLALGFPGLGMAGKWLDQKAGIPDIYHGGPGYVSDAAREYQGSLGSPSGLPGASQFGGTGRGGESLAAAITQGAAAGASAPTSPSTSQSGEDPEDEATPTGRTYIPLANVYDYGVFGPEHTFFTGSLGGDLNMRAGGDVQGPGDGQSDDIPAMLSNGEYVWSAQDVADLGGGSTDAGAKKLDQMRVMVRKHAQRKNPKKIAPSPKGITHYLKAAGIAA